MSHENTRNYPLEIKNNTTEDNLLEFTVTNNTSSECNVYLDDELMEKSNNKIITISKDISNIYKSKFHVKVETEDNFIIKTLNRDLSTYFNGLKKTLKGKDNTFFLVNDKNSEIRQHYDRNFKCNLDLERFRKSTLSKESFLEKRDMNYVLFIVPDKSVTLRDKLPFKTDKPYRHTDYLDDILYDLNPVITPEDMYANDTHISSKTSLKIVSYIESKLCDDPYEEILNVLEENTHLERATHFGDLFNFKNWSYDRDKVFHKNKKIDTEVVRINHDVKKVDLSDIPEEFRYISHRESQYYKNSNSISNKRAVILHDSTSLLLIDAFVAYYKEVFFYWDHWFFNDELIDWFEPNDVLEIRTERFLDNPQYQMAHEDYIVKFPISAQLNELNVTREEMNAKLLIKDYRQLPVKTNIKSYIDDVFIREEESEDLYYEFKHDLSNYSNGEHTLRFEIKSKYKYREVIKDFTLEDSLEPLFKDLKLTFKGIGDTFFMVNDNSSELRQHYDRMFNSKFNRKGFITSLNSKKSYLANMNINYDTFIIPDKSVVLGNYIPFRKYEAHRHVDSLKEHVVDLYDLMEEKDYLLNDTNVSTCAGLKIASYILSSIHNDKSMDEYKDEILANVSVEVDKHRGNLFTNKSWSYPDNMELHDKYYSIDTKTIKERKSVLKVNYNIPDQFKSFSSTESQFFRNYDSLSDKRVLILCDDSIKPLVPSLVTYYKEVFLYYDLWFFNKQLVEWYKPDDLFEIRSERTLENAQYQLVSIEDNYVIPVTHEVEEFDVKNGTLNIKINYLDLRQLPVESNCKIYVDNKRIDKRNIKGILDVHYKIGAGKHNVKVVLEASEYTKTNVFKQKVGV